MNKRLLIATGLVAVLCLAFVYPPKHVTRVNPTPTVAPTPAHLQTGTISGQPYTISLPHGANQGTHPLVLFMHGTGEPHDWIFRDTTRRQITDELTKQGYVIASSEAHGKNWGNDESLADQLALSTYVHARYHISKTVIWSESMGGLDGLIVTSRHAIPDQVGFVGTYPVANLKQMYDKGDFRQEILGAYHGKPDFARSPVNLSYTVPMKIMASYADTVVLRSQNTDKLLGPKTVVTTKGNHGDTSNFAPSDYVGFINQVTGGR